MSEIETINRIKSLLRQQELDKKRTQEGIAILVLGGNFEKKYDSKTHGFHYCDQEFTKKIIKDLPYLIRCEYICLKDTPDEQDYKNLILTASKANEHKIIIMGTQVALENAQTYTQKIEDKVFLFHEIETPYDLCTATDYIKFGAILRADSA